jgi:hypothetical protein
LATVETREIRLLPHQYELIADTEHRILGLVSGYGGGKTYAVARKACSLLLLNPGADGIVTEPNYPLLTQILIPEMEAALEEFGIPFRYNKQDGIFYCQVQGVTTRVICKSMESYARLIGVNAAWVIMDEFDTAKAELAYSAFEKLLGRLRAGNVRQMVIVSTPEGFKAMYRIFVRDAREGRRLIKARTADNWHLPADYIPSLMDAYPDELIVAYLDGEFVNLTSGTVYRNYRREANRSTETIKPGEPLHIGQDFNVTDMASVIYVQRGEHWHAVAELSGILDTPALIDTLQGKYEGHAISIYPDASGGSRKTVNASTSDIRLLRGAGFTVKAKETNPPVKDRILAMNTGYEKRRLWVNDKACPRFAEAQEQQAYDPKTGEPDKKSGHDHHNDAAGYFVHWTMPVRRPERPGIIHEKPAPVGENAWMG